MKSVAKNEEAVSPVIGTILLVAITVVLVAIVAAVVMGMVGNIGTSKNVGVTAQPFANETHGIIVTITGGSDVNTLVNITPYLSGANVENAMFVDSTTTEKPTVGQPITFELGGSAEAVSGQLTLTASFTDGSQAVILQNNVNIPAIKM